MRARRSTSAGAWHRAAFALAASIGLCFATSAAAAPHQEASPNASAAAAKPGESASRQPPAAGPETKALPDAQPTRFRAAVDKQRVTLGEPFTLTIEVTHPAADAYALPDPLPLGALTLRGPPATRREAAPEGARTTITLPLTDVSSLEPRVPDLRLSVQGPEGARGFTVPGQKLELQSLVDAEGAPNAEHAHHGPKPPIPVLVRSYLWAGLLAGLCALVAATVLLARFLRRRQKRVPAAPPVPAEDEALARLLALRRREPWKRGDGRAAIFELSETVRHYLGRRLAFDALDLTSEELLRELRARKLAGLDLARLTDELAWEDLVKFAKVEPTPAECVAAIDAAESLVQRTRPATLPQPPRAAKAQGARA